MKRVPIICKPGPKMARRRVFKTRVECPGFSTDVGITSNKFAMVGRTVTLGRLTADSGVTVCLDGVVVGQLDAKVGNQVASAIDRQAFTATVENAYPIYNDQCKATGAQIDIKVEYLLEKGQPAIEAPTSWRTVASLPQASETRYFFTTVAGVTFEGRQRIVARCSEGERLILVRDPNNRHDNGAIKVMRTNGEQVGFVPAHVSRGGDSSGLASRMDRGSEYQCRIKDITGGGPGKSIGVNIEITEGPEAGEAAKVDGSSGSPDISVDSAVRPALLLILAAIVIGLGLWVAFR